MQLRNDVSLNAIIHSLTKVVLPAVDAENVLAQEQLQLSIGLLQLMVARAPLEFSYDCDELNRLIAFSQDLIANTSVSDSADRLNEAIDAAAEVVARAKATPTDIRHMIAALRVASGALISDEYETADEDVRVTIGQLVLNHADEQLLRERAWVAPQGWELRPEEVPAIESLLEKS